jgi:PAS domain S-box-containing protein
MAARRSYWVYALALIAVVLATLLRLALHGLFGTGFAFITFYPAVAIVALLFGARAGVLATVLSTLAADYYLIPPTGVFTLANLGDALALCLFTLAGVLISAMAGLLERSRRREFETASRLKTEEVRRAGEQALHQRNEWLRVTLTSVGDAVIACDMDGRVSFLNPVAATLTGWKAEEAVGRAIQEIFKIINEQNHQPAADIVGRVLREGHVFGLANHTSLITRQGKEIPIEDSAAPIQEAGGQTQGAVLVFHDVTEKRKAENALRESERKGRLALDAARMGWWHYDPVTRLVTWDERCKEIFGVTGYEGTIEEILARLHPDDLPRVWAAVEAALNPTDPKPYSTEYRVNLPDGTVRWVEAHGVAAFEGEGEARRATSFVGTVADITARKQAEAHQGLATDTLRLLNRAGGDLPAVISEVLSLIGKSAGFDAVGLRLRQGDDCPYYEQNGFSEGFLREENSLCAKGKDGTIVHDAEGRAVLECTCGLVLSGGTDPSMPCFTTGGSFWTNVSSELLALAPEADPRTSPRNRCIHAGYQSVALFPVRADGEIIGLLQLNDRREGRFSPEVLRFFEGLADNIGLAVKRKQAEVALAAAKTAAEEANRQKDYFLAVLGHELRNPLAPIRNAIALMKRLGPPEPALQRSRDMIDRQVTHMTRLIDDLLDVSRIANGKITLRKEEVDLTQLVQAAVEDHRPLLEGNGLHVDFRAPEQSLWVYGDAARITQIVGNLLQNANKFTNRGGRVTVSVGKDTDGAAIVTVTDTGIGMDAATLKRIFEPFTQVDSSIDRSRGGLGLGLALAQGLVKLHGGEICADSVGLGKGAQFVFTLPSIVHKQTVAKPASSPRAIRAQRILVIEDNQDAAETLKMLLELSGHAVAVAHSGTEGVEQARRHKPEVVLCDVGLPGMNGYEVARALRADPELRSAYLIAMTGYGQDEDKRQALEAGFDHHITKPTDFEALERLLAR